MDLFSPPSEEIIATSNPLADRMRPQSLNEFVGQEKLIGNGKPLRRLIETDAVGSLIFWGPPGSGKTTLARIISRITQRHFEQISAVSSGVADLRRVVALAAANRRYHAKKTILFIDEIHRFNKTQQDAILPSVENGTIYLIGATTENPSFEIIPPLRSRCQIFRLLPLSYHDIQQIITHALEDSKHGLGKYQVQLVPKALAHIIVYANGDARAALNALEAAFLATPAATDGTRRITLTMVLEVLQQGMLSYDKVGEEHFNHASALQKSLRGSDPNAAIYWLAKMIAAGEDPRFIARRLVVTAAEDVGCADPQALVVAVAAATAAEKLGYPEARIPLAQATVYIATAPKSNRSLLAIMGALEDIEKKGNSYPVPNHLRESHYPDAKKYRFGKGYK